MKLSRFIFGLFLIAGSVHGQPRLPVNATAAERLPGVSTSAEAFSVEDIEAPAVVLLVFDMYCPSCQKSAGNMKRLAREMQAAFPEVPVLGVGYGDTEFETRAFRKKFDLPFPCVSDREKAFAADRGVAMTPTVIVLERPESGRPFAEIFRHQGYIGREHVREVLGVLKEVSG